MLTSSSKSFYHIQTQNFLCHFFSKEQILLEAPFPEIKRRADCLLPEKKIVFEVQCSPISMQELSTRNANYAKAGYLTIWILHEKLLYSTKKMSFLLRSLVPFPHYFSCVDTHGKGMIYDRIFKLKQGALVPVSPKFSLFPSFRNLKAPLFSPSLGPYITVRSQKWPVRLSGDLLDQHTFCRHFSLPY